MGARICGEVVTAISADGEYSTGRPCDKPPGHDGGCDLKEPDPAPGYRVRQLFNGKWCAAAELGESTYDRDEAVAATRKHALRYRMDGTDPRPDRTPDFGGPILAGINGAGELADAMDGHYGVASIHTGDGWWRMRLHTGGWHDNEVAIGEFRVEQPLWWMVYWLESRRGGHFVFGQGDAPEDWF